MSHKLNISKDVLKIIETAINCENLNESDIDITNATSVGDNYFGNILRIDVKNKSAKFIVKKAPQTECLFPVRSMYSREIFAYSNVLPVLYEIQHQLPVDDKFVYPKYYGCVKENMKEVIVLEDLADDGFVIHNKLKSLDSNHLELVVKALARFHAASFALKKIDLSLFEELSACVSRKMEYGDHSNSLLRASYKKILETVVEKERRNDLENFIGDIIDKLKNYLNIANTEPFNIICHGDCWIGNMMFKYENNRAVDVRFVDYQIIRYASPITDISYAIFTSTDSKIRSDCYAKCLDLYYETLSANIKCLGFEISECYPLEVYRSQIKSVMPFGLVVAIMLAEFIFCDDDDAPKIGESLEQFEGQTRSSKVFRDRVNGVVEDCFAYGFFE